MDGEVQGAERGKRDGLELGAFLIECGLPRGVRAEAGGAAAVVRVVPHDLFCEQGVGGFEISNDSGAQHRDGAVLESAEAALDLALGLRVGRDAVGDAQAQERALELGVPHTMLIKRAVRVNNRDACTLVGGSPVRRTTALRYNAIWDA